MELLLYTLIVAAFALGCIKIKTLLFRHLMRRKTNR